jgi:hypothetical protein
MVRTAIALSIIACTAAPAYAQVWQDPATQPMSQQPSEYAAPVDPSMQPQPYQYHEPKTTAVCTQGKNWHGRQQFFCN